MKIVVELKLVDDEGKVRIHHEAFVPLESPEAISLIRQYAMEKACSIRAEAVTLEQCDE